MWLKALDPFGLGAAGSLAFITFALFNYLDKMASAKAVRAVNDWIKKGVKRYDVPNGIVQLFDIVYGFPLLSIKTFGRVALISLYLSLCIAVRNTEYMKVILFGSQPEWGAEMLSLIVLGNIVSDYVSLFFVRKCLIAAKDGAVGSLVYAPVVGIVIAMTMYVIAFSIHFALWTKGSFLPKTLWVSTTHTLGLSPEMEKAFQAISFIIEFLFALHVRFAVPAILIHLWLPLMGIGILCLKVIQSLLTFIGFAQWFIKRGGQHPFKAIGLVATPLVFICAALAGVHF